MWRLCRPMSVSSPTYSLTPFALSSRAVRGAPRRELEAVKPPRKPRSDGQRDRGPARLEAGGSTSKDAEKKRNDDSDGSLIAVSKVDHYDRFDE